MSETTIKERPIIFTDWSVRAILAGRKTQTRRVVKPQPEDGNEVSLLNESPGWWEVFPVDPPGCMPVRELKCPWEPRIRLWVKETYTYWEDPESCEDFLEYKADQSRRSLGEWEHPHEIYDHCVGRFNKNQSPLFMHRWASRITLDITDIRCERLQDITEEDAKAEGAEPAMDPEDEPCRGSGGNWEYCPVVNHRHGYWYIWNEIHTTKQKDGMTWDKNPWVWVVEFAPITDAEEL